MRKTAQYLVQSTQFPRILTKLPKSERNQISRSYSLGPNSKSSIISKSDATKKPYSDMLLIYEENGKPVAYGIGASEIYQFNNRKNSIYSDTGRKWWIANADKIWAVTKDEGRKPSNPRVLDSTNSLEQKSIEDTAKKLLQMKTKKYQIIIGKYIEEKLIDVHQGILKNIGDLNKDKFDVDMGLAEDALKKIKEDKLLKAMHKHSYHYHPENDNYISGWLKTIRHSGDYKYNWDLFLKRLGDDEREVNLK